MAIKNVTFIGASGNLGSAVLPEILKSDLNVAVITRMGSSAVFPEAVRVVQSDYTVASLTEALRGQDAVVSMIPITAIGEQDKALEAAIAAGVQRFIPSEFGSDTVSDAVITAVPFFEPKRKHLDLLKTEEDKISWTGIITGPFFDWSLNFGLLGFDLTKKTATLVDGGKTKFTATSIAQIGRSIVAVLAHPTETANKLVYIESFTTTQLEVLAVLEKVTGGKWTINNTTSSAVRAEGKQMFQAGDLVGSGACIIKAAVLGEGELEDHTHLGIWNEKLGLPKEDMEAVVKQSLGA